MCMRAAGFISSWQEAEDHAVAWMRDNGCGDARPTKGGADGGIDVRSKSALAQVKYEASQVGRPAVQRLVGARGHGAHRLLFFTGTGYSRTALQYADEMGVALFTYEITGRVSPVNEHAREVLRTGGAGIEEYRAGREITGAIFVLLGLAILGNTAMQTFKFLSGDGMDTWTWWAPLWLLPLSSGFLGVGALLFKESKQKGPGRS